VRSRIIFRSLKSRMRSSGLPERNTVTQFESYDNVLKIRLPRGGEGQAGKIEIARYVTQTFAPDFDILDLRAKFQRYVPLSLIQTQILLSKLSFFDWNIRFPISSPIPKKAGIPGWAGAGRFARAYGAPRDGGCNTLRSARNQNHCSRAWPENGHPGVAAVSRSPKNTEAEKQHTAFNAECLARPLSTPAPAPSSKAPTAAMSDRQRVAS
jgi:hypothetical protein